MIPNCKISQITNPTCDLETCITCLKIICNFLFGSVSPMSFFFFFFKLLRHKEFLSVRKYKKEKNTWRETNKRIMNKNVEPELITASKLIPEQWLKGRGGSLFQSQSEGKWKDRKETWLCQRIEVIKCESASCYWSNGNVLEESSWKRLEELEPSRW